MKFKSFSLALVATLTAITLAGCGGGGGSGSTALTPATQAPAASTGPATTAGGVSTELASNVAISGYRSVSIAATSGGSVTTASLFTRFKTILANAFIKPAFAQSSTTCQTDAYKLVGVGSDGTLTPLPVTQGSDACNVGFREMFDLGSYALLTGEGIYKDGLTCNLVFLQKSSGNLYCVGESLPSRYQVTSSGSGSSAGPATPTGSTAVAEKIQTILDADGGTSYALLNAQSTTFDSNNQISGLKTKLLRFDLRDAEAGPKVAVLVEGYQSGWSQYTTASEFEYFNLENYRLAKNGDALVLYYKSIWTPGGGISSNANTYRRNLKYFYDFVEAGDTFSAAALRDTDALSLINIALASQASSGSSAQTATNWGWLNISCMFDAPANDGGILITTPSQSWISGYNNGMWYQNWSSASSIFRVSRPNSSSSGQPVFAFVKPSLLCSDTSNWNGNLPQKVGDTWYTMQTASYWGYDASSNYSWGTRTSIIGNTLGASNSNTNDDVTYTVPAASGGGSPAYYWGANNTNIRASKDYLYLLKQGNNYMMAGGSSGATDGIEVSRFKPSEQTSGAIITGVRTIVSSSEHLSISAFTTNKKDNTVDFAGRNIASIDLDKIYGTISEDGLYTPKPIVTTKFTTMAIVKL